MDDPDRAAVGDDQHRLFGMPPEDVFQETADSRAERVERLSVLRAVTVPRLPPTMCLLEAALDFRGRQAFPCAEASFAQTSVEPNLETELTREDLRRLASPRQVAGVDDVDAFELGGNVMRLAAAELVERSLRVALPAAFAVPIGLAVSDEEQSRHAV